MHKAFTNYFLFINLIIILRLTCSDIVSLILRLLFFYDLLVCVLGRVYTTLYKDLSLY